MIKLTDVNEESLSQNYNLNVQVSPSQISEFEKNLEPRHRQDYRNYKKMNTSKIL